MSRGDVVALHLGSGLAQLELLHAMPLVGAVLLPLNLRLTAPELVHPLRDSGARLLIHDASEVALRSCEALPQFEALELPDGRAPSELARELPALPFSPDAQQAPLDLTAPLALLYTSGTTGLAKGALLSHRNFLSSAAASAALLGNGADDRWLLCMPLFHVGGLSILLRSVLAGSTAVIHERFDAEAVAHAIDEEQISIVSLVPAMLERLLVARGERAAPPQLRCILLGGAAASPGLLERARELGYPVAPTYGLTEACSQVATRPPGRAAADSTGLHPLPGLGVRIVDEKGAAQPPDAVGEICVRGPMVMSGYWKRPDASASALREGWLHTGDMGELDAGGRLRVLDRRDDLIVSGGENVYPAEVEAALLDHDAIVEAAVAGVADADFGARPVAWLVLHEGAELDAEALREHCRARLAAYKVPLRFHRVDCLPRNAAGKLLRRELCRSDSRA
ncbi:MAG: o-succinylbenzoate--CoA ligase [Deltaproteobacteria bacterium]|nr:o-succinylbenzoate--CoA ligase [Deltaproteobacteria bacterium]